MLVLILKWYIVSCAGSYIKSGKLSVMLVLILTVVHSHLSGFDIKVVHSQL